MNTFQTLANALAPHLLDMAGIAVAVMLAGITGTLKARWGIEIEARHREALHSALMTGIASALGRGLTGEGAVTAAIMHVSAGGAPDAVRYFELGQPALERMARAKLQELLPGPATKTLRPPLAAGPR